MVLVGENTNATPRASGASSHKAKQRDSLPLQHFRLRDENHPYAKGRTTPKGTTSPSQRLLSSTKSSAAKISGPSRVPLQRSSKPLREQPFPPLGATKISPLDFHSEAATDDDAESPLATRTQSTDTTDIIPPHKKSRSDLPKLQTDTDSIRKAQLSPTPLYQNAAMPTHSNKPLPKDKPLPSRPVLSFINSSSPSKRSRSLMDATDRPMAVSIDGAEHEWPALTPRSYSAPARELLKGSVTSSQSVSQRSASASAATDCIHSSEPASATTDNSNYVAASDRDRESPFTEYLGDHWRQYPNRNASLCPKASSGSLAKVAAVEQSRQLAPSPSSFSRPRIGSSTQERDFHITGANLAAATSQARTQRTASRIPIPDSKKARLVEVKSRPTSRDMMSASAHGLSFGARRLDAPDTMKIIDNGVRRRQLQRRDTDHSTITETSMSTRDGCPDTPALIRSNATSPDATLGTSSSDEEEVVTPSFKATAFTARMDRKADSDSQNSARRLFESPVDDLQRGPPPTSPFAASLPTIPSQSVLPSEAFQDIQRTSSFSTLHERFSKLYNEHVTNSELDQEGHTMVSEHARASLLDLLNEYTSQDGRQGSGSMEGIISSPDRDVRAHISTALSMLEGGGTPTNTEVSSDTILQIFGHLKRDHVKTCVQKDESLTAKAVAAEKYLTGAGGQCLPPSDTVETPLENLPDIGNDLESQFGSQLAPLAPLEGVASKWSGSTASLAPRPLSSHPLSEALQAEAASSSGSRPSESAGVHSERPQSIGYPMRIASKAGKLIGPGSSGGPALPSDPLRRTSSPTLGNPQQHSMRTASKAVQRTRGGFAAPTASAEARKMVKTPKSRSKPFSISGIDSPSQSASANKGRSKSEGSALPKTLREQSKGRNMLSKINSMFSVKRDKKHGRSERTLSPLSDYEISANRPSRSGTRNVMNDWERDAVASRRISPFLTPSKSSLLPKMPTSSSPHQHNAPAPTSSPSPDMLAEPSLPSGNATHNLCASLIKRAKTETQPARKERLLTFAKVLNDSLISAREAQISAETAQHAAKSAQMAYEMTVKSVAMLQRLATGLTVKATRQS